MVVHINVRQRTSHMLCWQADFSRKQSMFWDFMITILRFPTRCDVLSSKNFKKLGYQLQSVGFMTKLQLNNFSHSHQKVKQCIVHCAPLHRTESCTRQFHIILFNVLFNVQICFWVESVFIEFVELNLIFQSVDYRNWCFFVSSDQ